ncbi:hypothetical protein TI39_contig305g00039 [Zymoseptoria brevis]|uniref:Uncharacterized protein n=1 Tax=Zymoseptoria brevis TaxID=1047168 RepID=A0A0F4GVE9_9PEZI|nr:hypothetical protein TI39_contig305g00039 [Zymoseptoria brevis]
MTDQRVAVSDGALDSSSKNGERSKVESTEYKLLDIQEKRLEIQQKKLEMELEDEKRRLMQRNQQYPCGVTRPCQELQYQMPEEGQTQKRKANAHDRQRESNRSKHIKAEPGTGPPAARTSNFIDLTTPPPAETALPTMSQRAVVAGRKAKHNYAPINADYPSIAETKDGSLVELRCSECGANSRFCRGDTTWLEAGQSLAAHYINAHREIHAANKMTMQQLNEQSVYKILSNEEANAVRYGTGPTYIIEPVLGERGQAQYDKRSSPEPSAPVRHRRANPTPAASTNGDEDDEEDIKPQYSQGSATMMNSNSRDASSVSASATGRPFMAARKSAPACGQQAKVWPGWASE